MIGIEAVEAARQRTAGELVVTPAIHSPRFSEQVGAEVHLKCESFQRTGSFKARGALNKLLVLSDEERARGVIAASAGNHAQGVAFAADRVGAKATIVMPEATPLVKVSATRRWGAEVVLHGATFDEAWAEALRLQEEGGMVLAHAFEDPDVVAGQGTVGLEILEQVPAPDLVLVPIGGGGLISGIATVLAERSPETRIVGVQCESAPSMHASFHSGQRVDGPIGRTLAEGIAVKSPGRLAWEIISRHVDDVVLVSEEEIEEAIYELLAVAKVVAEGAGAAAVAALLHDRVPDLAGKRVVVVLSGANIDLNVLSRLIERSLVRHRRFTRLRLSLHDRPGALAQALAIVGRHGANVLRIEHERFFSDSAIWETEVELTLETRDREQVDGLLAELRAAGYTRISQPDLDLVGGPVPARRPR